MSLCMTQNSYVFFLPKQYQDQNKNKNWGKKHLFPTNESRRNRIDKKKTKCRYSTSELVLRKKKVKKINRIKLKLMLF